VKLRVLLCVLAPLLVLLIRARVDSDRDLAEAARVSDDADAAARSGRVAALGRVARRLGGPTERAREQLAALGRRGDLSAWQELRASILSTRNLVTPAPALLDESDHAIADQLAQTLAPGLSASDPRRVAQREAEYQRLRHSDEPRLGFSLIALVGAILFIGGMATLLLRGRRPFRIACVVAGFALYLVGLWRA
jgi:hypothetical protein